MDLYYYFRTGSLDGALDLVGRWSQLHPSPEPQLTNNFFELNGRPYHNLAVGVARQYPPHLDQLQERFLPTPEGDCSLPVAYARSYAYLMQDRMQQWIALVDSRLADKQLQGDRRVNWLIARARAEEIRFGASDPYLIGVERLNAGQGWLQEAELVAETEAARLRAFREMVTRLAALGDMEAAEAVIQMAETKLSGSASRAAIAQWRAGLDEVKQTVVQTKSKRHAYVQRACEQVLERRLQRAVSRSDSQAEMRYRAVLEKETRKGNTKNADDQKTPP